MKDIEVSLENADIHPDDEIRGTVIVNYSGRYDGIVINAQILDSNELITYRTYNGREISKNVSRLFVNKDAMPENRVDFTASIGFQPKQTHDVKFRVSIIEQHKEVESDILFGRFSA